MTRKEIKNCADYKSAQKAVEEWNTEDFECNLSFKDYEGKMYYWSVGSRRTRLVRRGPWREYKK